MKTISEVTDVNGATLKVEYEEGGFEVVHGDHLLFVAGDLLMAIGGPIHLSATITTLFRRNPSDGIFRYVGTMDLAVIDDQVNASLCGNFEHSGWVERKRKGSSMEFELPSHQLWASAEFRFKG